MTKVSYDYHFHFRSQSPAFQKLIYIVPVRWLESSLLIDIDPRKEKGIRASCLACLLASKIFLSESIERFCYLFLFLPEDRRKGAP